MPNDEKTPGGMGIDLERIKLALRADVTHKPGAIRLDEYPLLVYAPTQHGAGVRTEDRGVLISKIAAKALEEPDHGKIAAFFGTTPAHVRQALDYYVVAAGAGES